MKRTGKCPKCGEERIVRLDYVLDAADWLGTSGGGPKDRSGNLPVCRHVARTPDGEVAATEAYVCASCGWLEEYVKSPGDIRWEDVQGAAWYRPSGRGYR